MRTRILGALSLATLAAVGTPLLDDATASTDSIFIRAEGRHPHTNTFTIQL